MSSPKPCRPRLHPRPDRSPPTLAHPFRPGRAHRQRRLVRVLRALHAGLHLRRPDPEPPLHAQHQGPARFPQLLELPCSLLRRHVPEHDPLRRHLRPFRPPADLYRRHARLFALQFSDRLLRLRRLDRFFPLHRRLRRRPPTHQQRQLHLRATPRASRGRYMAFAFTFILTATPTAALLATLFVPHQPFGIAGWRFVVAIGALGGIAVWFLQRGLPNPHAGRGARPPREAEAVVTAIEGVARRRAQPARTRSHDPRRGGRARPLPRDFGPFYLRRTIVISIFQFCQTIGVFGFGSWVPVFLARRGFPSSTRSNTPS